MPKLLNMGKIYSGTTPGTAMYTGTNKHWPQVPVPYLQCGTSGGFATTPRIAGAYQITSDVVITARVTFLTPVPAAVQMLFGQYAGGTNNWRVAVGSANGFYLSVSDGVTKTYANLLTAAQIVSTFGTGPAFVGVKFERDIGGSLSRATAIYSPDKGVTWVDIGTPKTAGAVVASTDNVSIGVGNTSTTGPVDQWLGTIAWAEMRTGLDPKGGTVKLRYDASEAPPEQVIFEETDFSVDTDVNGIRDGWVVSTPTGVEPAAKAFSIAGTAQRITATLTGITQDTGITAVNTIPAELLHASGDYEALITWRGTLITNARAQVRIYYGAGGALASNILSALPAAITDPPVTSVLEFTNFTTPTQPVKPQVRLFAQTADPNGNVELEVFNLKIRDKQFTDPRGVVWTHFPWAIVYPS